MALKAWIAMSLALAASTSAAQVEYVTRNVQPTHAVRFGSQPIRITITDRGIREPLASAPVIRRHAGRGGERCGPIHGGRIHIVMGGSTTNASGSEGSRSRTVYGRARTTSRAASPVRADEQRHLLRCLALIQAENRQIAQKQTNTDADDR